MTDSSSLTAFNDALAQLREQIDGVDNELIALFKKRSKIVEQVGHLKAAHVQPDCYIRPAREAVMVKRIAEEFKDGGLPPAAAASMWRLIIAASTNLEKPMQIVAHTPADASERFWLAREYFGSFTAISKEPTISRAIGQLIDGKAQVAIVPPLHVTDAPEWWPLLLQSASRKLAIFASLPVTQSEKDAVAGRIHPVALAVGAVEPEPTGDDLSYLVLDVAHDTSQNRLTKIFADAGLKAHWLSISAHPAKDRRRHLVQIEDFIDSHAPIIRTLHDTLGDEILSYVHCLGSHARPLTL